MATAAGRSKKKSVRRSELQRKNMNATLQWLALVVVFTLLVVAFFVFGDPGGGGGHTG